MAFLALLLMDISTVLVALMLLATMANAPKQYQPHVIAQAESAIAKTESQGTVQMKLAISLRLPTAQMVNASARLILNSQSAIAQTDSQVVAEMTNVIVLLKNGVHGIVHKVSAFSQITQLATALMGCAT
jgi:uncharacterized protein YkvS